MTLPLSPRTLRLAASSFDAFRAKGNLTAQEHSELLAFADLLRAVARGEADLHLSAFAPDVMGDRLERELEAAYRGDPDGGLARAVAADEWVNARLYAEGMEPMDRGGGASS